MKKLDQDRMARITFEQLRLWEREYSACATHTGKGFVLDQMIEHLELLKQMHEQMEGEVFA